MALCTLPAVVHADDVSGADRVICSILDSEVCLAEEGCAPLHHQELNIPQFIRIDARSGVLSTTEASGENRQTKADSVTRSDGQLILQGVEEGRAFSIFIDEPSGHATFAAAADALSVAVFAACTPDTGK
ncbi:MAG: hypothetical protein R3212_08785 [Xanthomonadales bacterium]|nr:hypothetical protein [Xanthomonadales bacterium]